MRKHDDLRELAALAAIGQVSFDEYRELSEHLRGCESCRHAGDQYASILDELPLPEPSATPTDLQKLHSASYRQRFLQRASAEGLHFTREALGSRPQARSQRFRQWRPFAFGVATAAAVAILIASLTPSQTRTQIVRVRVPARAHPLPAVRGEGRDEGFESQLKALRRKLATAQKDRQKLLAELENWKNQAGQTRAEREQTRQQLGKLSSDKDQLSASLVAQETRIMELSEQLQTQTETVDRERQLTAAARDVRDMMGARNLHIIDVADLDWRGKSKKSFGRVFYAEGRSLVFYAFDLPEKGTVSQVSFQAWGQKPSSGSGVKNLGVFHIDDQVQKRWVLRVDDPTLLGSIDSLFVTVEPAPGRERPSGQKLLYAYLGTPINHP